MTTTVDSARTYARENGGRFLDELFEMLRDEETYQKKPVADAI